MSKLPKTHEEAVKALTEAQKKAVVIGLADFGTEFRLEIDDLLLEKPDTFNLFLLALKALQEDPDITKPMGYFQVAGIHGLPRSEWNGVTGKERNQDWKTGPYYGYCAHGRLTFPTWHRPYLAMMEQTLFVKMREIALEFTDQEKHLKAAEEFRLPYWDYYRPRGYEAVFPGVVDERKSTSYPFDFGAPQIFMLEKVLLRLPPHGDAKFEYNPLRTFWFPPKALSEDEWDSMEMRKENFSRGHTVRHLLTGYNSPFQGSNIRLNEKLNKERASAVSVLLSMIAADDPVYAEYETFAAIGKYPKKKDDPPDPRPKVRYGSLEALHNQYHGNIGDRGHMGRVPIAAFDPIFWMHHANIDRYLAIWQAVNPKKWFDGKESSKLLSEDLKPFFSPEGGFWNSSRAEHTASFGYIYSDVKRDSPTTRDHFRDMHAWSLRPQPEPLHWQPTPPEGMIPLDLSNAQVYDGHPEYLKPIQPKGSAMSLPVAITSTQISSLESASEVVLPKLNIEHLDASPSGQYKEWFVDNEVERLVLDGAFSIDYFIGPKGGAISADAKDYNVAPTLAGSTYVFAAPTDACDNCGVQRDQALIATDTTSITPMLMDYIKMNELESLDMEHVKPFLVDRLKWRVQTVNGDVVDPRNLSGFQISISNKISALPIGSAPPDIRSYPEITKDILKNASRQPDRSRPSTTM